MHFKKCSLTLKMLACFVKLLTDQGLTASHQLLSWISVEPSKCPMDKMIGLQGHLTL